MNRTGRTGTEEVRRDTSNEPAAYHVFRGDASSCNTSEATTATIGEIIEADTAVDTVITAVAADTAVGAVITAVVTTAADIAGMAAATGVVMGAITVGRAGFRSPSLIRR